MMRMKYRIPSIFWENGGMKLHNELTVLYQMEWQSGSHVSIGLPQTEIINK